MLDNETKRRIDTARDILVGKVPDPKSQVEQITIALIYKFMDDMDKEAVSFGGKATFFTGDYKQYSWTNIFDTKVGGHEMLSLYSEAIVKLNLNPNIPQLFRDIFKNAYLPYRDPETLKLFLKTINEFSYDHSEKLGDAFEYLLSIMGSQGDAGQFRTPRHIIDFIVEIVQPKKNETILDPACGTAGFLISSYKHILQANTKKTKGDLLTPDNRKKMMQNFVGYDISPDMVRLSLVNLYLHGFTTPSIYEYDTLTSEDRWNEYYDVVIANPPFMTPKGGIKPHKKFTVQANRSEVLFVDYIAEHIHPSTGRAGIIVPEGIIFQSATAYKALRKMLVDKNYLYAVVSLPAGVFNPYSGVKTSILLMDKTLAKKTDKILFVKIENDGFDLGAQRREIDKNDLPEALNILQQYKEAIESNQEFTSDNQNVLLVEKKKIGEKDDYNLSIDRYRENGTARQSDFEMVRLGDVCEEIFAGGDVPNDFSKVKTEQHLIPIYSNGIGEKSIYGFTNIARVNKQCVTISARGTIGYPEIRNEPFFPVIRLIVAIPNSEVLNYRFLKYVLEVSNIKGTGNTIPQLTVPVVKELQIPLPPISIQQQIVNKIEGWQKIIDGAKQVVENYKPQIEIDESWEMVELGSVCEVINGRAYKQEELLEAGKYPVLRVGNFFSNRSWYYSDLELPEDKYCDNGDLLYAWSASFGPKIWDGNKVIYHYHIWKMIPDETKINKHFLCHILERDTEDIKTEGGRGIAMIHITKAGMEKRNIPIPSLSEQQAIVKKIESEQALVIANKQLIQIFEQKIKDEINKLWKQEPNEYAVGEEKVSIAAEE